MVFLVPVPQWEERTAHQYNEKIGRGGESEEEDKVMTDMSTGGTQLRTLQLEHGRWGEGHVIDAVFITFPVAVIKHSNKSNFKEKAFVLAHSLRL